MENEQPDLNQYQVVHNAIISTWELGHRKSNESKRRPYSLSQKSLKRQGNGPRNSQKCKNKTTGPGSDYN